MSGSRQNGGSDRLTGQGGIDIDLTRNEDGLRVEKLEILVEFEQGACGEREGQGEETNEIMRGEGFDLVWSGWRIT